MTEPYDSSYSEGRAHDVKPSSPTGSNSTDLSLHLQDLKLDVSNLHQEIRDLHSQSTWLKVLLAFLVLFMVGSFAWFTIKIQSLETVTPQPVDNSEMTEKLLQIESLQQQVRNLENDIPGNLNNIINTHDAQFQQIEDQLESLRTQLKTNTGQVTTPRSTNFKNRSPAPSGSNQTNVNSEPSQEPEPENP